MTKQKVFIDLNESECNGFRLEQEVDFKREKTHTKVGTIKKFQVNQGDPTETRAEVRWKFASGSVATSYPKLTLLVPLDK